jgi:hypothetical protein
MRGAVMANGQLAAGESSARDYFTEQLLTILVCGLFGFAAIQMYRSNMLSFLNPAFHEPVLYGGIGILILVALRAVAVWNEAGELQAKALEMGCGIDHVHSASCNHGPGILGPDGEPDHTHTTDMTWVFVRMMILAFPVALFFMGLPNGSFSKERQLELARKNETTLSMKSIKELAKAEGTTVYDEKMRPDGARVRTLKTAKGLTIRETTAAAKERDLAPVDANPALTQERLHELAKNATVVETTKQADGSTVQILETKDSKLRLRETLWPSPEPVYALITGDGTRMGFNELNAAAYDSGKRESLEGSTVIVAGKYARLADKEFSLFRLKMTCCAADAVPLKVRIIVPQALTNIHDGDWVEVKGQLQFYKVPNQGKGPQQYVPVLLVAENSDVHGPLPEQSEYEF